VFYEVTISPLEYFLMYWSTFYEKNFSPQIICAKLPQLLFMK
jgi:hypothetical protein